MPENQAQHWIQNIAATLASVGGVGWVMRVTGRTSRIEQKVDHQAAEIEVLKSGVGKIHKHITGVDLW